MTERRSQSLTALVCTSDRRDSIVRTAASILRNDYSDFELLIIDQSDAEETADAVRPFLADPRVRYLHSATKGLGTARNLGLQYAWGEILAITDDDCAVPADWLEKIVAPLNENPKVGIVFCNVLPVAETDAEGFVPHYRRQGEKTISSLREKKGSYGMGAGMALRRDAALAIGGFDEMLGAGAAFPSFDDVDMALRLLVRGYHVYETARTSVDHFGFRDLTQTRRLVQRDGFAIGAGYAKLLRCKHYAALTPLWDDVKRIVLQPGFEYFVGRQKHLGMRRAGAILRGFIRGWRTPIDRATLRFSLPMSSDPQPTSQLPTKSPSWKTSSRMF